MLHIVKSGDTLSSISRMYGVPVQILRIDNSIANPDKLAVGQAIIINIPTKTYKVNRGDTLFSIASRFGTTVNDLYKNNLILQGKPYIYDGQELIISIERDPIGEYQIGGYMYPFISDFLLGTTLPFINYMIPFTYGFTRDAHLIAPDYSEMRSAAEIYGAKCLLHLSTLDERDKFSVENAEYLLDRPELWEVLFEEILKEIKSKKLFGLDIDFEFLGKKNADSYAEFVAFMREKLNNYGYGVTVALAPKTSDGQPGDLYEGHDYALLGKAANSVLCMTYEWGYTYGPPLAVSPIPNVKKVLDYAVSRIPSEKIFEGISNYGYDFKLPYIKGESKATSLSTRQATSLASEMNAEIIYDPNALAPYFYYTSGSSEHVVWFEDVRSIMAKLMLFKEYNLKGGLIWNLNRENDQALCAINYLINRASPSLF